MTMSIIFDQDWGVDGKIIMVLLFDSAFQRKQTTSAATESEF